MWACPALRPRRDLHVRPWVYGKPGPGLRTFRRTRLPRTMPASQLANNPTTCRYCLPYIHTTSAPTTNLFRGSITQPAHSLSTLRNTGYPNATQDSLPAGGQPLPDGIHCPLGPSTRFQQYTITASPHPSFPGARGLKYVIHTLSLTGALKKRSRSSAWSLKDE